jgi:hypothetical protein
VLWSKSSSTPSAASLKSSLSKAKISSFSSKVESWLSSSLGSDPMCLERCRLGFNLIWDLSAFQRERTTGGVTSAHDQGVPLARLKGLLSAGMPSSVFGNRGKRSCGPTALTQPFHAVSLLLAWLASSGHARFMHSNIARQQIPPAAATLVALVD